MELSKQIKKYRTEANLSQEELADKIFVSRQTISNWENDKNYPDIKSLVLMSEVFQVSLDNLIKGDLERMFAIGMYFAIRIEKYKKKYDIQTYKEIVAFTDGKSLDEIEKAREEGKRPYQKTFLAAGSAALVVIIALIMAAVMKLFS